VGIVREVREAQEVKVPLLMVFIEVGIEMEAREKQLKKA